MKKEFIIVIVIIIAIFVLDFITHNYTENSFKEIKEMLYEIKTIAEELQSNKEIKEEGQNTINDEELKHKLSKKVDEIKEEWESVNGKSAYYIEHDELEKVSSLVVKFSSYFKLEEYSEAIPELENCIYILEHIEDKQAMKFINLF